MCNHVFIGHGPEKGVLSSKEGDSRDQICQKEMHNDPVPQEHDGGHDAVSNGKEEHTEALCCDGP